MIWAWQGKTRFEALPPEDRSIVFYSEDNASWVHFEPIIRELIETHRQKICYLTSSPNDPVLDRKDDHLKAFYIGMGIVRTIVFYTLRAGVMVMTMPDLENYYAKRSRSQEVHYVYVFHNMASTHMVFRFGAYDHYDAIFCVGPHHLKEIRKAETLYKLKPKVLVEHGNSRLDSILHAASQKVSKPKPKERGWRVLIAPSYGKNSILEQCGVELVDHLLSHGNSVTVRPHPLTFRDSPKLIDALNRKFSKNPDYVMERDVASQESLHASHLMVSDFSGAAFEYVFGLERPVLFIDVPRKVNNPEYEKLECEPFEVFIRSQIGVVVHPDSLQDVPKHVDDLCYNAESYREKIRTALRDNIFNVGSSGKAGAEYLVGPARKFKAR